MDFSDYYTRIMAKEEAVEKAARRAEKIAKKIADDAEEFFRNKPRSGFHHPRHFFDGHHSHGPASTTTIYHYHHHYGKATATETPIATVTSTTVITSTATLTCAALTTSTAAAASAAAAFLDTAATPIDSSLEGVLEYVASVRFWILTVLLISNAVVLLGMLEPSKPKTKSSIRPKQRAHSLVGIELDLACLKPYITTRCRQIAAVLLCRLVIALYFLEGYWALDLAMRVLRVILKIATTSDPTIIIMIPLCLVASCGFLFLDLLALDQQFTLDGELLMLEVPTEASGGTEKLSMESESEGDW